MAKILDWYWWLYIVIFVRKVEMPSYFGIELRMRARAALN